MLGMLTAEDVIAYGEDGVATITRGAIEATIIGKVSFYPAGAALMLPYMGS